MKNVILFLTIILTLAGTLLVPAQSVSAAQPDAPLRDLVTTNDNNEVVTYSGTWTYNTEQTGRLFIDDHTSATTSDYVELAFTGGSISLIVTTGSDQGEAEIYIDTVLQETVDLYSASEVTQHVIYNKTALTITEHTIKVVVKGTKNASSSGYTVNIDAFRFTDAADTPPPGANEIECRTQAGSYFQCTQVTTQSITIAATSADPHYHPRWKLNASGVGTVYARMVGITVHWTTNAFSQSGTFQFRFDPVMGGSYQSRNIGNYYPNGNATISVAEFEGENVVAAAGNYETLDQVSTSLGFIGATYNTYILTVQTVPFTSDCVQQYTAASTFGPYVIDPTEDEPSVGIGEQALDVVAGTTYLVRIGGDGWHNASSADEFEAEYTFPGWEYPYTWTNFADETCVGQSEGYYKYSAIVEVPAGAMNMLIRVHDTGGNFADNYMDANEYFVFTIAEVSLTGALSCQEQFTYDEEVDWVAMAAVDASQPYIEAVDAVGEQPLVDGDWYVVQITGGMWQDDGDPPDRFDAQYSWGDASDGEMSTESTWRTFGAGGDGVYCSTYDGDYATIYVQAEGPLPSYHPPGTLLPPPQLWLRVNDELLTFSENTGALIVHIYHASFERVPSTCETTYGVEGFVGTTDIPATAENGVIVGVSTSLTTASFGGMILKPGSWYMLETQDGPWAWLGTTHQLSYDLQVQWGGDWVPLESWAEAVCNVAVDGVGHRRLFFQTPATGSAEYKFRVADTGTWFNNTGLMRIGLYGAYDMVVSLDDGSCDYVAEEFPFVTKNVNGNDANGDGLGVPLSPNGLYAIQIVGNPSWSEQSGGSALYAMQISVDGGGLWQDLPNGYAGVLCYYNDGNDLWFFMNGVDVGELASVRFRVDSETFSNNTGGMTVNVYGATEGDYVNPWATCLGDLGVYVLDEYITIDVKAEGGQYIPIQTAWTSSQNLVGFLVKIDWAAGFGMDYWTDGETETQHKDAALSPDNGTTWGPLDPTNTAIVCATRDAIGYASAYFQVAEGDKWKIRVNDIGTDTFDDNGRGLAYKLYAVTTGGPVDCVVDTDNPECIDWTQHPSGILIDGIDICDAAIIQPVVPSGIDVPAWLQYVAEWVVYAGHSVMAFGAWCPRHSEALASIRQMFMSREPLATYAELRDLLTNIQTQLQGYNWADTGAPASGLEQAGGASGGGDAATSIVDSILPKVTGPWAGGPLITPAAWVGSIPYSDCINEFSELVPNAALISGLCFVSANAREAGMFIVLQIMLDVSMVVLLITQITAVLNQLAETLAGGPVTTSGQSSGDG